MLDYCGEKNITCDVEVPIPQTLKTNPNTGKWPCNCGHHRAVAIPRVLSFYRMHIALGDLYEFEQRYGVESHKV